MMTVGPLIRLHIFRSELFGGGVPTPESWAWQSIFQNLWVVWCWSLPELMAIDGN